MGAMSRLIPPDYAAWLDALKGRIRTARRRAALALRAELIRLYHQNLPSIEKIEAELADEALVKTEAS